MENGFYKNIITLREGVDYKVTYSNNINAGKANYAIEGLNSCYGDKNGSWTIYPSTIAQTRFTGKYTYTGKPILAACSCGVAFPNSSNGTSSTNITDLVKGQDYTVSYKNNVNVGTASACITLINGNYTFGGSKKTYSFSFEIQKAANPLKHVTISKTKHNASTKTLKKKAVTFTPKYKFENAQGTITIKKASGPSCLTVTSKGAIKVRKGTPKGTYKAVIAITAKGNSNYKPATARYTATVIVK